MIISRRKVPRFLNDFFPGISQENYADEGLMRMMIQKQAVPMDIRNVAVFSVNESDMLAVFELRGMVSQKKKYKKSFTVLRILFLARQTGWMIGAIT